MTREAEQQRVLELNAQQREIVAEHVKTWPKTATAKQLLERLDGFAKAIVAALLAQQTPETPEPWKALEALCEKWQHVKDVAADPDLRVVGAYIKACTAEECANALPELLRALKGISAERDRYSESVSAVTMDLSKRLREAEAENERLKGENEKLKDAITAVNTTYAEIRTLMWDNFDPQWRDDRSLVGLCRLVVNKLHEARDNRKGEYELRTAAEAELAALKTRWEALKASSECMNQYYRETLKDEMTRLELESTAPAPREEAKP